MAKWEAKKPTNEPIRKHRVQEYDYGSWNERVNKNN
jgi:hypothetical protein